MPTGRVLDRCAELTRPDRFQAFRNAPKQRRYALIGLPLTHAGWPESERPPAAGRPGGRSASTAGPAVVGWVKPTGGEPPNPVGFTHPTRAVVDRPESALTSSRGEPSSAGSTRPARRCPAVTT